MNTTTPQPDAGTQAPRPGPSPPSLLRTLIAVVFGFFTFAATLTIGMLLATLLMGSENVFQGDTWHTSVAFEVIALLAAAVGAFMGGAVCRPLGGSPRIVPIFAAAMLLTVIVWLVLRASAGNPEGPRDAGVADMRTGRTTAAFGPVAEYGLPVVACVMAYLGGALANRVQRGLFGR